MIYDECPDKCKKILSDSDLLFTLDFNDLKRANNLCYSIDEFNGKIIMIDHHQNPAGYSDIEISEPDITSTSEMIYKLIELLLEPLNLATDFVGVVAKLFVESANA